MKQIIIIFTILLSFLAQLFLPSWVDNFSKFAYARYKIKPSSGHENEDSVVSPEEPIFSKEKYPDPDPGSSDDSKDDNIPKPPSQQPPETEPPPRPKHNRHSLYIKGNNQWHKNSMKTKWYPSKSS